MVICGSDQLHYCNVSHFNKMSFNWFASSLGEISYLLSANYQILAPHVVPGGWARRYEGNIKIARFDMYCKSGDTSVAHFSNNECSHDFSELSYDPWSLVFLIDTWLEIR